LAHLADAHQQLDDENPWTDVLEESSPPAALDDLVVKLCEHARVAARLASAAELLCSSLFAQRYRLQK
jgi:hypothetical protein